MEVVVTRILLVAAVALLPGAGIAAIVAWIAHKLGVPMPRFVKKLLARPTARERILSKSFGIFTDWVLRHHDSVFNDLPVVDDHDNLAVQYNARMAEIRSLYDWWTVERPARAARIEERRALLQELGAVEMAQDDEVHLARLANVWRDLT